MKRIKGYFEFLEDGCAAGCGSGSGDVSNPVVGTLPGVPGKAGSGDVSRYLAGGPKKRKKGSPSEVSDLRDLEDAKINRDPYSVKMAEAIVAKDSEEYKEIRWALIDLIDQGFNLRIKKYDDPEDIQEMTIGMFAMLDRGQMGAFQSGDSYDQHSVKGKFKDGEFGLSAQERELNEVEKDILGTLESACLNLLDILGYDQGSFSIDVFPTGQNERLSTHIHIHMMKK